MSSHSSDVVSGSSHQRRCLSIVTGHPRADRRRYLTRLLDQLHRHPVLSAAARYDIHVYCDGDCGHGASSLTTKYQRVVFHSLATDAGERRSSLQRGLNLSDTVRLSGVEFRRHRWLHTSRNYRRMLEDVFAPVVRRPYQSCVFLEDDLVLAPDALDYLEAVEGLMLEDRTVFAGSLFADNSYPPYAREARVFRRVSHFAGLGFVLTRRQYLTALRRAIREGRRNWDEVVQRFVAGRRLVSVVPELSRALHLRRVDAAVERHRLRASNSTPVQAVRRPRHLFESQLINDRRPIAYDLSRLQRDAYDRAIADMAQHRPRVRYVADALFLDNMDDVVVYHGCQDDKVDLHQLLTARSLWGVGNGGVVRGSYRGTLLLRYFAAQVLVVCRGSEFYRLPTTSSTFDPRLYNNNNITIDDRVDRSMAGIVYRLTRDFHVITAATNQSCDSACAAESTHRMCDVAGLWLLSESCDVIRRLVPGCLRCARSSADAYADGALPALDRDGLTCWAAYPHYISCETASARYRRLCACL